MPSAFLTDRTIAALPFSDTQTEYWDTTLPGFLVRVGKKTKTFQVMSGIPRTRTSLGKYPGLTLQEAKIRAKKLLANPESHLGSKLVKDALNEYIASLTLREKTIDEYTRLLERMQFHGKLRDVSTSWLLKNIAQYSQSEARALYFASSAFFSWCTQRRYLERHPLSGVRCPYKQTSRDRVLTNDEIVAIWKATEAPTPFNEITRLLITTAQRKAMIANLRREWILDNNIRFPSTICKNHREQLLPINPLTAQLLKTFSFPYGYSSWSKPKAALDKLSGVSGWVLHDFRTYFATTCAEELSIEPHIIEAVLHHQTGSMSALSKIYNKAKYTEPMRECLNTYSSYISYLISK